MKHILNGCKTALGVLVMVSMAVVIYLASVSVGVVYLIVKLAISPFEYMYANMTKRTVRDELKNMDPEEQVHIKYAISPQIKCLAEFTTAYVGQVKHIPKEQLTSEVVNTYIENNIHFIEIVA